MSATCCQGGACGDKAGNVRPVCPGHSQLELTTSSTSFDPRSPWGGCNIQRLPFSMWGNRGGRRLCHTGGRRLLPGQSGSRIRRLGYCLSGGACEGHLPLSVPLS